MVVNLDHLTISDGDGFDMNRQRRSRLKMLVEDEHLVDSFEFTLRGGQLLDLFRGPGIPAGVAARCDVLDLFELRPGRQAHRRSEIAASINLVIVDTQIRCIPVWIVLEFYCKT